MSFLLLLKTLPEMLFIDFSAVLFLICHPKVGQILINFLHGFLSFKLRAIKMVFEQSVSMRQLGGWVCIRLVLCAYVY
ncbi:MAG: hypothetical protein IK065_06695 [Neisseriaceae bacterium]|nr:hypothetical protein [Neisseriaceae bacterium]